MIKLEAQGKKESQHYKALRKDNNELIKKIKDNVEQIGKLTKEIKVSDLTMNQLRKEVNADFPSLTEEINLLGEVIG